MANFEQAKDQAVTPLLAQAGAALYDSQGLEYGLALLMFHLERLNGGGGLPKIENILENRDKKTLGQLFKMLGTYTENDSETELVFRRALDSRNHLIHRLLVESADDFVTAAGRKLIRSKIRSVRKDLKAAESLIRPLIHELGLLLDGFDPAELEAEIKARFEPEA